MKEQRTWNGSKAQNYKEDVAHTEQVLTFLMGTYIMDNIC